MCGLQAADSNCEWVKQRVLGGEKKDHIVSCACGGGGQVQSQVEAEPGSFLNDLPQGSEALTISGLVFLPLRVGVQEQGI